MNILGGSGDMLPQENLKFRSSKTAGNAPKTCILLILSLFVGMHPYYGIKKSYCTRCTGLKLTLYAWDLVEFCHTVQTGLVVWIVMTVSYRGSSTLTGKKHIRVKNHVALAVP